MKAVFSPHWIKSKKPSKQRKYRYNAPLHIRGKFLHVLLDRKLREKYARRSVRVRKGDTVKILRGQFKGKEGKITEVDVAHTKVYVENIQITKKDGSKTFYPLHPSNLMIVDLALDDKKRVAALTRNLPEEKQQGAKESVKAPKKNVQKEEQKEKQASTNDEKKTDAQSKKIQSDKTNGDA